MASFIVVELMAGFVGGGVARLVARATRSRKKRVTIMDYRCGVRSAGGKMGEVLLPGCYSYDTRKETILVVDMRPQPVLIERLFCRDALNRKAVISAATELSVLDAVKASTGLRDHIREYHPHHFRYPARSGLQAGDRRCRRRPRGDRSRRDAVGQQQAL